MEWFLAWSNVGTLWFVQLCMLLEYNILVGNKSDYLLYMSLCGAQREDADVKQVVKAFRKEFFVWNLVMFLAAGGCFLLSLLPAGSASFQVIYITLYQVAKVLAFQLQHQSFQ